MIVSYSKLRVRFPQQTELRTIHPFWAFSGALCEPCSSQDCHLSLYTFVHALKSYTEQNALLGSRTDMKFCKGVCWLIHIKEERQLSKRKVVPFISTFNFILQRKLRSYSHPGPLRGPGNALLTSSSPLVLPAWIISAFLLAGTEFQLVQRLGTGYKQETSSRWRHGPLSSGWAGSCALLWCAMVMSVGLDAEM